MVFGAGCAETRVWWRSASKCSLRRVEARPRRASTRLLRERVWRQVILAVYVWDALNFQQHGAAGIARGAHNPEVLGSKPSAATNMCCSHFL